MFIIRFALAQCKLLRPVLPTASGPERETCLLFVLGIHFMDSLLSAILAVLSSAVSCLPHQQIIKAFRFS